MGLQHLSVTAAGRNAKGHPCDVDYNAVGVLATSVFAQGELCLVQQGFPW